MRHYGYKPESISLAKDVKKTHGAIKKHQKIHSLESIKAYIEMYLLNLFTNIADQRSRGAAPSESSLISLDNVEMLATELEWMKNGGQTYFLESLAMAESLISAAGDIPDPSALLKETSQFVLMAPEGLMVDGKQAPGIFVTTGRKGEIYKEITEKFISSVIDEDMSEDAADEMYSDDEPCLMIKINVAGAIHYAVLSASRVTEILANPPASPTQLSDRNVFDKKTMRFVKLVCGFMVYKHALPHRLEPGLPAGACPHEFAHPSIKNQTTTIVKSPLIASTALSANPSDEHGKAPHYRKWHFRQLMAPRYYQGEHAHLELGSRIVFVADSYIHSAEHDLVTAKAA